MDMDLYTSIPFESFNLNNDFKCDICNKFLSIAPILYHESVGKVCGRCFEQGETKKYVDITFETQSVYERIAKHIVFPCSFQAKGCEEKLEWKDVSQHEDTCCFRENKCPFSQDLSIEEVKCEWNGKNQHFFRHLLESHAGYFNDELRMTFPVSDDGKDNILISYFNDIPVVAVLYVSEDLKSTYFHLLMDTSFVKCESFTYDLEVSDALGKHKMVFPENRVVPLCERAFTRSCLLTGFYLDIAGVQALMRNKCFYLWFNIKSKELLSAGEEKEIHLEENILREKCRLCLGSLTESIYVCESGHNICSICYRAGHQCHSISPERNTLLEFLSKISLYECTNREHGCSELVDYNKLKYHETNCNLSVRKCVMECDWNGTNLELLGHLVEEHVQINLNEDYSFDRSAEKKQMFFTVWDEKIFVFFICHDHVGISVKVRYISVEKENYRFEFSIKSGKLQSKTSHYCHPFVAGLKQPKIDGIYYPFKFLSQFLREQDRWNFSINLLR